MALPLALVTARQLQSRCPVGLTWTLYTTPCGVAEGIVKSRSG